MKFAHHVSTRMNYCSGSLKPLRCLKIRGLHLAPPFLVEDHVPVAVDAHRNGLLKVSIPAISVICSFILIKPPSMAIMQLSVFMFLGKGRGG